MLETPDVRTNADSPAALQQGRQYSCHSLQVACQHRQFEVLVHTYDASIHRLSKSTYGLAPTEVLLMRLRFTSLLP
ncbi:hypothetical protein AWB77_06014 [Caballeronia fortuita]|uniref:Uncharacterized protein n=1 Tax=Caballeronia fortuita TaxID=1777138 RepID=A0A158DYW8_9BURK|nr:hypothetical protein AWB77_06014 [Caballeronia fortuita]